MSDEKNPTVETAHLLVVDDEESIRVSLSEALRGPTTRVSTAIGGEEALRILADGEVDLVLLDQRLSATGEDGLQVLRRIKSEHPHVIVIMMTAYGRFASAVEATQLGCHQYLAKPLDLHQLQLLIDNALSTAALSREVRQLRARQRREFAVKEVVGTSLRIRQLLETVHKIARSRTATVLIRGETGAGKELVARLIHEASHVAGGPFVDINCGAVPDNLLESELFGHEKGAFTDAKTAKEGLFELADGGTLFLDEIAEMPAKLQSKLLRVLETKSFRRVGGTRDIRVAVRILAATNRDLFAEVEAGRFREDLYYRLTVIPIHVPPLRERREDIAPLAKTFLDHYSREIGRDVRRISDAAMAQLLAYAWPGNVRELKNMIERAVLLGTSRAIEVDDLPEEIRQRQRPARQIERPADLFRPGSVPTMDDVERVTIQHALDQVGGNRTRAASLLGMSRQTLRTKIEKYGLDATDEVPTPGVSG